MLTSASGRCSGLHRAVGPRHPVVEQHHVVLDHAEPLRLGILARTRRVLLALQRLPLLDVGARAVRAGLLVVPQREADRALGLHVRHAEDARQLHHQRRARSVVVRGFAPAVAVHVRADDVHLVGTGGADLRAVHLFARARSSSAGRSARAALRPAASADRCSRRSAATPRGRPPPTARRVAARGGRVPAGRVPPAAGRRRT